MQKSLGLVFLAAFMMASVSFAFDKLDLSGTWELQALVPEGDRCYAAQLLFVPTTFSSNLGGALYMVEGNIQGWQPWAVSIELLEGQLQLRWWGSKDQRFEVEIYNILNASNSELSLGLGSNSQEVAKLIRVADLAN